MPGRLLPRQFYARDALEVARDLLKLLDTKARIKVLVYRARTKGLTSLKEKLEGVFARHASDPRDDFWLVIGIPTYTDWHEYVQNRAQPPRQVYVLGKDHTLMNRHDKWWNLSTSNAQ